MNAVPRFDNFLYEDGEKRYVFLSIAHEPCIDHLGRIEITEDSKIPNAATIKVVKQDHTLANLLRA